MGEEQGNTATLIKIYEPLIRRLYWTMLRRKIKGPFGTLIYIKKRFASNCISGHIWSRYKTN